MRRVSQNVTDALHRRYTRWGGDTFDQRPLRPDECASPVVPDSSVAPYDSLARFYDAVNGEPAYHIHQILAAIDEFRPASRDVLELGCGTGGIGIGFLPHRNRPVARHARRGASAMP